MSELAAASLPTNLQGAEPIAEEAWTLAKPYVAKFVWDWFNAHKDEPIYSIMGVIHIHVGIIEPIIIQLFGEEPVAPAQPGGPDSNVNAIAPAQPSAPAPTPAV